MNYLDVIFYMTNFNTIKYDTIELLFQYDKMSILILPNTPM